MALFLREQDDRGDPGDADVEPPARGTREEQGSVAGVSRQPIRKQVFLVFLQHRNRVTYSMYVYLRNATRLHALFTSIFGVSDLIVSGWLIQKDCHFCSMEHLL